jgi:hypothetical protein
MAEKYLFRGRASECLLPLGIVVCPAFPHEV